MDSAAIDIAALDSAALNSTALDSRQLVRYVQFNSTQKAILFRETIRRISN
jgi:hypothetical protein